MIKEALSIPSEAPTGLIWIGLATANGAGSWHRSSSLSEVIDRLPKTFRADFASLGLKKSQPIRFAVFLVNDVDCEFVNGNVVTDDGSEVRMAVQFTQAKAGAVCVPGRVFVSDGEAVSG